MRAITTLLASTLLVALACTPSPPPDSPSEPATPASRAPAPTDGAAATVDGEETLTAKVLEAGPIGDGACVQRSYFVRASEGGAQQWIHFERCGGGEGPDYGGLKMGGTYRFRLRRGASPNFGEEPMILDAQALD